MAIRFVVRDDHRWWLAPVPGHDPVAASLDDVLAALADRGPSWSPRPLGTDLVLGADPGPRPATATERDALAGSDRVAPVWRWVGALTADGVVVDGNAGRRLVLDAVDLRVLDVVDGAYSVDEVARRSGVDDAGRRLAVLCAAGRARRLAPDEPYESPARPLPPPPAVQVEAVVPSGPAPRPEAGDGRVPVHAMWLEWVGPPLSLGMLTAAARAWEGGSLDERFEIRRPEASQPFLAALAGGSGPAVLLCSNYVWSVDHNLAVARAAKALRPDLVVIHGGPSTPKYPGDAEQFLDDHGAVADILVRGEGEVTLCRLLEALAPTLPALDADRLASVAGITFRDPSTGAVVRTGEPERVADLDTLPSPYLTGEFDDIDPSAWLYAVSIETNRGCPYGCTFCDWGSAILSRLRKFSVDRVLAEFEWAAMRGVGGIQICDANFGIIARDVDLARGLADVRRRTGHPMGVGFTPPKNTTKHITKILDAVMAAGLHVSTAISLQSIDEATLDAVDRSNISTSTYMALAADLRRRGHPLMGDLLLGLPAQTYESYKADLQFFVDHQIMARTWIAKMLPNSPMNAPEYRARYSIETDRRGIVASTASLAPADLERAHTLRRAEIIAIRLGVLRHVGRFLQWDHGIAVTDLLAHVIDVTSTSPDRFPLVTWLFDYFDVHATAPVGWPAVYGEVRRLVAEDLIADDLGVDGRGTDLDTVLRVQVALMPAPGRILPATVALAHDYEAYHRAATATLFTTGRAGSPPMPLVEYPPASFTVTGDPLRLCEDGLHFDGDSRDPVFEGDFAIGQRTANELASPLLALLPVFSGDDLLPAALAATARATAGEGAHGGQGDHGGPDGRGAVPVRVEAR